MRFRRSVGKTRGVLAMDQLSKTSLNYYLSEYLADLKRAGVQEIWRGDDAGKPDDAVSAAPRRRPAPAPVPAPTPAPAPVSKAPNPPTPSASPAKSGATTPKKAGDERVVQLQTIAAEVARCERCPELVANRTQTVFGSGNPYSELVFIGEGPGAEEDLRGEPFVGRSGKLLTDMIEKGMGLPRSDVFICNVVRCRPPGNRNPAEPEARACRPFLDATLDVVRPKFICCLGSVAATNLLNVNESMGRLRGNVYEYKGAQVVCTYHPAYLLRNPPAKKDAWQDLQLLMKLMGLELPSQRKS